MWKIIDENCLYSKNLYNYAMYIVRKEFLDNGKYIKYNDLDKMLQSSEPYKQLMSQPSQCTLQMLDRSWKSFFKGIKGWKKYPEKYLGMPNLPNYKPKNGRFPWFIKNTCCSIKNGEIYFKVKRLQEEYKFKTNAKGKLLCVRFIPHGSHYTMEVVTEIEIPDFPERETKNIASIDLCVNNFVTLTNNIGLSPIIINGRGIKSINQYYNKRHSKAQSDLRIRNNMRKSDALGTLDLKRKNRLKNYIHHSSRFIVNFCKDNGMDTLVCGLNKTWKQDFKSSKANKQNFIDIPYDMLIRQLEYKCEEAGIKFLTVDEAYTSGTSFLDGETACKENYNKKRRVKRGLFQASETLINADVNGSLQIMTKVFLNAFGYGIEGNLTPTIINATKIA
jgi:putative transposase